MTDHTETYYRIGTSLLREYTEDDHRIMALYFLTCDHRSTEGLYYLPPAYIPADLGWTAKRSERAALAVEQSGLVRYDRDNRVCLIVKALKWQAPANPNQVKAALRRLSTVPGSPLWSVFVELADRYCEPFSERLRERFPERFTEQVSKPMLQRVA